MKLQIYENKEVASKQVALYVVSKINEFGPTPSRPFVMGLPTGSSPEGIYQNLIELYNAKKVSFENVVTFNMDEYLGLPPSDPQSYHYFMYSKFFNHINIKPENVNILNGLTDDVEAECSNYEAKIKSYGEIQLFLGGLGPEGHIAFNERGSSRDSKTRKVQLVESTIIANSRFWNNDTSKVPKYALSVGISTVLDNSKEVIIVVFGSNKHNALKETIEGEITSRYPCTYLQEHKNCIVVTDYSAVNEDGNLIKKAEKNNLL
ncbi:hypothetical protein PACTADRAFT_38336 [Pachysolen tannophilus NRRL Y-2460]|uniref:Glucosamine-6-phosphate isomerase n=1 Tax=Pachysolen tannophilus NRRL Y-2460 TaxID=669874 RepID=A0A1E4U0N8_PACTA|nr:hypothetical protein PACTADRAFT_38336 [Pachysolen tannophilus NRRL Y-2460]